MEVSRVAIGPTIPSSASSRATSACNFDGDDLTRANLSGTNLTSVTGSNRETRIGHPDP